MYIFVKHVNSHTETNPQKTSFIKLNVAVGCEGCVDMEKCEGAGEQSERARKGGVSQAPDVGPWCLHLSAILDNNGPQL